MLGYQKILIGAAAAFLGRSLDKLGIKDWAKRNISWRQIGNGLKDLVSPISNGIRSIGRGIRRLFGGRRRSEAPAYVPLPPTPAVSNHQLSSGWQNEGFGNTFKERIANIHWKKTG
jgi:hypothetical protein